MDQQDNDGLSALMYICRRDVGLPEMSQCMIVRVALTKEVPGVASQLI